MKPARWISLAAAWLPLGCQTYVFEPVAPLAIAQTTQAFPVVSHVLAPNVMIAVDNSGSMLKPVDPTNPNCAGGSPDCSSCGVTSTTGGSCPRCPASCPTRSSDLKAAMSAFLSGDGGTLARYGLIELPRTGAGQCTPSSQSDIVVPIGDGQWSSTDDGVAMQAASAQVAAEIDGLVPWGGTPTAGTLGALAADPDGGLPYLPLVDPARASFVLLLTDGEPNCNDQNPNDCTTAACECTLYSGVAPSAGECPGPQCRCNNACRLGCIDTDAVSQSIDALRQLRVRTIPIGFGLETLAGAGVGTGYAPGALNAMATHGGFSRACQGGTDAECDDPTLPPGSPLHDTCDVASGLQCLDGTAYCCHRRYWVALDQAQLEAALAAIAGALGPHHGCFYHLDATPTDPSLLLVLINGNDLPATDAKGTNWTYQGPSDQDPLPSVTFQGATCDLLNAATAQNPVQVEFRIVQRL